MSDFLSLDTEKLGVDTGTAQAATGGLMNALKDKLPSADGLVDKLKGALPELGKLLD